MADLFDKAKSAHIEKERQEELRAAERKAHRAKEDEAYRREISRAFGKKFGKVVFPARWKNTAKGYVADARVGDHLFRGEYSRQYGSSFAVKVNCEGKWRPASTVAQLGALLAAAGRDQ